MIRVLPLDSPLLLKDEELARIIAWNRLSGPEAGRTSAVAFFSDLDFFRELINQDNDVIRLARQFFVSEGIEKARDYLIRELPEQTEIENLSPEVRSRAATLAFLFEFNLQFSDSLALHSRLSQLLPESFPIRFCRGLVLYACGHSRETVEELNHARLLAKSPQEELLVLNVLAQVYEELDNREMTSKCYLQALHMPAWNSVAPISRSRLLNNIASSLLKIGKVSLAKEVYQEAIRVWISGRLPKSPGFAKLLTNYAVSVDSAGDHLTAFSILLLALSIDENGGRNDGGVSRGLINISWMMMDRGFFVDSELLLIQATKLDEELYSPNHPQVGIDEGK